MTPDHGAKAYLVKINDEIACYEELLYISKIQINLVRMRYYGDLPEAVGDREKVLKRIKILRYLLNPYEKYWSAVNDSVDESIAKSINIALAKFKGILAELEESDRKLKIISIKELGRIKQELAVLSNNKAKTKAYRRPIFKPAPRYVNKVSV